MEDAETEEPDTHTVIAILKLWGENSTQEEIANALGLSVGLVERILLENGQ